MKVGSYVKHFLYRNRGEKIYRYGIVLEIINIPRPPLANIFWHTVPNNFYINKDFKYEKIKIQLLELISEPR